MPGAEARAGRRSRWRADTHDASRDQVKAVQIVFQNPDSALNRRHTRAPAGGPGAVEAGRTERIRARAAAGGADPIGALADRYLDLRPSQLSGGLKQRVAIARAFAGRPAPGGVRRADLGAGRVGAGGDAQPAGRAAGQGTGRLPVHQPRPGRRSATCRIASACSTSAACSSWATPKRCSRRRTTPTPRRCCRRCRRGRQHQRAHQARWRDPQPRRPAQRVRVPHALPTQAGRDLRDPGTAAGGAGAGSRHPLPHPARPSCARCSAGSGRFPRPPSRSADAGDRTRAAAAIAQRFSDETPRPAPPKRCWSSTTPSS